MWWMQKNNLRQKISECNEALEYAAKKEEGQIYKKYDPKKLEKRCHWNFVLWFFINSYNLNKKN